MIFLLHSVNVLNDFLISQCFWGRSDVKCPAGNKSRPAENNRKDIITHLLESINQLHHLEIWMHWCTLKFIDAIDILTCISYSKCEYIWRGGDSNVGHSFAHLKPID